MYLLREGWGEESLAAILKKVGTKVSDPACENGKAQNNTIQHAYIYVYVYVYACVDKSPPIWAMGAPARAWLVRSHAGSQGPGP